jgi:hypothetical protein
VDRTQDETAALYRRLARQRVRFVIDMLVRRQAREIMADETGRARPPAGRESPSR